MSREWAISRTYSTFYIMKYRYHSFFLVVTSIGNTHSKWNLGSITSLDHPTVLNLSVQFTVKKGIHASNVSNKAQTMLWNDIGWYWEPYTKPIKQNTCAVTKTHQIPLNSSKQFINSSKQFINSSEEFTNSSGGIPPPKTQKANKEASAYPKILVYMTWYTHMCIT